MNTIGQCSDPSRLVVECKQCRLLNDTIRRNLSQQSRRLRYTGEPMGAFCIDVFVPRNVTQTNLKRWRTAKLVKAALFTLSIPKMSPFYRVCHRYPELAV